MPKRDDDLLISDMIECKTLYSFLTECLQMANRRGRDCKKINRGLENNINNGSILIHLKSKEQIKAFEQMAKAMKVPFEIKNESPYNSKFIAIVKQANKDFKDGKGRKMKLDEIWK